MKRKIYLWINHVTSNTYKGWKPEISNIIETHESLIPFDSREEPLWHTRLRLWLPNKLCTYSTLFVYSQLSWKAGMVIMKILLLFNIRLIEIYYKALSQQKEQDTRKTLVISLFPVSVWYHEYLSLSVSGM